MTLPDRDVGGYVWRDAEPTHAHDYLLPALEEILNGSGLCPDSGRVLDLGCGNGVVTAWLAERGFDPVGIDPSPEGIAIARSAHPELEFHQASVDESLPRDFGSFAMVVCLEVIEHVYDPVRFARRALDLLRPGGVLLLSTPYHGWLKNVAVAVLGKFDAHVNPLRVHGHIKFWSRTTLRRLLESVGFELLTIRNVGRIPPVACSMMVVAARPV